MRALASGPRAAGLPSAALALLLAAACRSAAPAGGGELPTSVEAAEGGVAVLAGGLPFATYRYAGAPRPCLWPLLAPGGVAVTRAFPLASVEGERPVDRHHTSLWLAHGDVDGHDFWNALAARIENGGVVVTSTSGDATTLSSANRWVAGGGELVCTERRTMRFVAEERRRAIDLEVRLVPAGPARTFGDDADGTLGLRLRDELAPGAEGVEVLDGAGGEGAAAGGGAAAWLAVRGTVAGAPVTVLVLDHPTNPHHPTRWRVEPSGLVAANPFALSALGPEAPGAGAVRVPEGASLRLRYRVVLLAGAAPRDRLAAEWRAFARE